MTFKFSSLDNAWRMTYTFAMGNLVSTLSGHDAGRGLDRIMKSIERGIVMGTNKYAGTKTEKNLWEAFAGESQARDRKSVVGKEIPRLCRSRWSTNQ